MVVQVRLADAHPDHDAGLWLLQPPPPGPVLPGSSVLMPGVGTSRFSWVASRRHGSCARWPCFSRLPRPSDVTFSQVISIDEGLTQDHWGKSSEPCNPEKNSCGRRPPATNASG